MENDKHLNAEFSNHFVEQIEDLLLEMMHDEARLKMQIEKLRLEIDHSLQVGNKALFFQLTSRLNEITSELEK